MNRNENIKPKVLNEAKVLFLEFGYEGTKVPQIADSAGISVGNIYRYFKNKEDIINELYINSAEELIESVQPIIKYIDFKDFREIHKELFKRIVLFSIENRDTMRFLLRHHENYYISDENKQYMLNGLLPVFHRIFKEIENEVIKKWPVEYIVSVFIGTVAHLIEWVDLKDANEDFFTKLEQKQWETISDEI